MNTARSVTVSLTAAAAGDYAAGDVLSQSASNDVGVALEFAGLGRKPGDHITLIDGIVKCNVASDLLLPLRLHLFNRAPVAAEVEMDDNVAFSIKTTAGKGIYLGSFDFLPFRDDGALLIAEPLTPRKTVLLAGTSLFVVPQTRAAETNESAGMVLDFTLTAY